MGKAKRAGKKRKYNEENKNSTFCRKTERGVAKKRRKKEKIEKLENKNCIFRTTETELDGKEGIMRKQKCF